MTLFSMEIMAGVDLDTFARILKNLAATTMGNIVGGMALSFAYWSIARKAL
jgi:formate/nitrite transporter FocA (FNT family)